jgi:predicted HD phosphohydrolase
MEMRAHPSADAVEAVVEEIVAACESMRGLPYDGEPVDQLEHALQSAALARASGADRETVVAALLHDIARAPAVAGIMRDAPEHHHGELGSAWLTPRVGARAAWLAEQHVDAKRYLVAAEPAYRAGLSPTSEQTLAAQGGPMGADELAAFRANPDWEAAVELRRWDDAAKVPGLDVPRLDAYRDDLRAVVVATLAGPA